MIDISKYIEPIKHIAAAMESINDYSQYRKHTTNELIKGITGEVAYMVHIGMRVSYQIYLDKKGDGGSDINNIDIKYIPENGKYLILYHLFLSFKKQTRKRERP